MIQGWNGKLSYLYVTKEGSFNSSPSNPWFCYQWVHWLLCVHQCPAFTDSSNQIQATVIWSQRLTLSVSGFRRYRFYNDSFSLWII